MKYVKYRQRENLWSIYESGNNDDKFNQLALMFEDNCDFIIKIKKQLFKLDKKSIQGNLLEVEVKNNKAYILPTYEDFPEDHPTIIDKDILLRLVNEWLIAIEHNPDEIVLQQDDQDYLSIYAIKNNKKII